jgi:hypothetical protein
MTLSPVGDDAGEIGVRLKMRTGCPLILRISGGAPFSFMPANAALRCHSNKADRSSRACDGRHSCSKLRAKRSVRA